jgi:tRNA-splicing endonuclease subunit Sen2
MSETKLDSTTNAVPQTSSATKDSSSSQPKTRGQALNKLYALPAPLRTFPLPTVVPHNPVSLFHVLYVWLFQNITRPSSHQQIPFEGWWSPDTRSIHVTEIRSIRGLWEQGFYGKGSLSRSEPHWLNKEKARKGTTKSVTSEELTRKRRLERQQTKWERARKEREAIDQKLLEEAAARAPTATNGHDVLSIVETASSDAEICRSPMTEEQSVTAMNTFRSPVGPLELLSLPNSHLDLILLRKVNGVNEEAKAALETGKFPAGTGELLALPDSSLDISHCSTLNFTVNGSAKTTSNADVDSLQSNSPDEPFQVHTYTSGHMLDQIKFSDISESEMTGKEAKNRAATNSYDMTPSGSSAAPEPTPKGNGVLNGIASNGHTGLPDSHLNGNAINNAAINGSVESDETIQPSDSTQNSPVHANGTPETPKSNRRKSVRFSPTVEKTTFIKTEPPSPQLALNTSDVIVEIEEDIPAIQDKEHLQLTLEEAFFLTYSLGILTIRDPVTKSQIPTKDLFTIFRKASSFFTSNRQGSLSPDDPFMLNYVVYHHFRSLGWVVRGGTKFSVDFMIYNRGPVFSHAEFAILILPSYSDEYWSRDAFMQNYVKRKETRTWAWLHCINRVVSQVKKTLILVYIDIPKPLDEASEMSLGVDGILERYKVREVVMQRWQSNRSRD